ncbi:MAG TPA: hypothetical protein VLA34_13235 [Candidatus Krumholzibacterium sp.]|nr:hypothetical protein [Candidatus Krumholzibacterium sp.]
MIMEPGYSRMIDRARRTRTARALSAFLLLAIVSCSGGDGGDVAVLEDPIFGFYLGERKDDLFERVRYVTSWREIEGPRTGYRGEMYEFSRAADRSKEVESLRLSFIDGRLAEIVAYMKMTNVTQLNTMRDRYTGKYGVEATSPDGSTEMAYKTYWIKVPEMSITIRRITKKPRDELYVQFIHDQLHSRMEE